MTAQKDPARRDGATSTVRLGLGCGGLAADQESSNRCRVTQSGSCRGADDDRGVVLHGRHHPRPHLHGGGGRRHGAVVSPEEHQTSVNPIHQEAHPC